MAGGYLRIGADNTRLENGIYHSIPDYSFFKVMKTFKLDFPDGFVAVDDNLENPIIIPDPLVCNANNAAFPLEIPGVFYDADDTQYNISLAISPDGCICFIYTAI